MIAAFNEERVDDVRCVSDVRVRDYLGRLDHLYRKISNSRDDAETHVDYVLEADRTSRSFRLHVGNPETLEDLALFLGAELHQDLLDNIERTSTTASVDKQQRFSEAIANLEMRLDLFKKVIAAK